MTTSIAELNLLLVFKELKGLALTSEEFGDLLFVNDGSFVPIALVVVVAVILIEEFAVVIFSPLTLFRPLILGLSFDNSFLAYSRVVLLFGFPFLSV